MRGQIGTLLPRQAGRRRTGGREAALRYAGWGWPVSPGPAMPATSDLEAVFAAWTRLPAAPVLAACGEGFDVVEADLAAGRAALGRLDRLGICAGPVTVESGPQARVGFLVRPGCTDTAGALLEPGRAPLLIGAGAQYELPAALDTLPRAGAGERWWLRAPGDAKPQLPSAYTILGALALAPHARRAGAYSSLSAR